MDYLFVKGVRAPQKAAFGDVFVVEQKVLLQAAVRHAAFFCYSPHGEGAVSKHGHCPCILLGRILLHAQAYTPGITQAETQLVPRREQMRKVPLELPPEPFGPQAVRPGYLSYRKADVQDAVARQDGVPVLGFRLGMLAVMGRVGEYVGFGGQGT